MDELKELIQLAEKAGTAGIFLLTGWRLAVRYVPNWREKIEKQRHEIAMCRELGLSDAEIRERLGIAIEYDAGPPPFSNPAVAR